MVDSLLSSVFVHYHHHHQETKEKERRVRTKRKEEKEKERMMKETFAKDRVLDLDVQLLDLVGGTEDSGTEISMKTTSLLKNALSIFSARV